MNRIVLLAVAILAFMSVLVLIGSLQSFESMAELLRRFNDGDPVERFTERRYLGTVWLARGWATVGICSFVVLWCYRASFALCLSRIVSSCRMQVEDSRRGFLHWLAAESKLHLMLFAIICVEGIGLRLMQLSQPMRSDESWTYLFFATKPWLVVISDYSSNNNHILHTLLAKLSLISFGEDPIALRMPAFVAGCLLLPLGYLAIRRLYGSNAALIGLSGLAVWPMLVDYSANARGYSIMILLTLALVVLADRLRQYFGAANAAAYALVVALGMYTIPTFLLPAGAIGVWLVMSIFFEQRSEQWSSSLLRLVATAGAALIITLALYTPVLVYLGFGAVVIVSSDPRKEIVQQVSDVGEIDWAVLFGGVPPAISLVLVILFIVGTLRHRALAQHRVPLALSISLWVSFITLLLAVIVPVRVWIFAMPVFLMAAAAGLSSMLPSKRSAAIATVIAATIATGGGLATIIAGPANVYQESGAFREAADVVDYLAEHLSDRDALLTAFPANKTLSYYAQMKGHGDMIREARLRFNHQYVEGSLRRLYVIQSRPSQTIPQIMAAASRARFVSPIELEDFEVNSSVSIGSARVSLLLSPGD